LASEASETLPFWSAFPRGVAHLVGSDFDPSNSAEIDELGSWTHRCVLLPALAAHLGALSAVSNADADAAQRFAQEIMEVASARNLTYLVTIPLSGIDLDHGSDGRLVEGDVVIRRLDGIEQGSMITAVGSAYAGLDGNFDLPLVALELHASGPRDAQYLGDRERVARLVAAMQLNGYQPAGQGALTSSRPAWVHGGLHANPVLLPRRTNTWTTLDATGLRQVVQTEGQLASYHLTEPRSPHDIAVHRYSWALARTNDADAILDFTIVLESLLLPYDEDTRRGELGYRFRIHGAHYLANSALDRLDLAQQLATVYRLRSRLVHGGQYPNRDELIAGRTIAYQLARRGLLRAVGEGFPSSAQLTRMALGTT
jgi:hypothetical protein